MFSTMEQGLPGAFRLVPRLAPNSELREGMGGEGVCM